jgi:hypothetical protein
MGIYRGKPTKFATDSITVFDRRLAVKFREKWNLSSGATDELFNLTCNSGGTDTQNLGVWLTAY